MLDLKQLLSDLSEIERDGGITRLAEIAARLEEQRQSHQARGFVDPGAAEASHERSA